MHNESTIPKIIRITTVPMALRYLLPGQMNFIHENGYEVLMISADGRELKDVISSERCRHIIVPMTRKITPFQDLICLVKLIKIFKKEKPQIVHSHTPKAGLLGMLAAKICGVKIRIHTVAGLPMMVEKGFKFKLLKFIEKVTYAAANHVWPNSNSLFQYISKNKLTSSCKLSIIGKGSSNGINTDRFNNKQIDEQKLNKLKHQIGYSKQNKYLLNVGRLVKDKGIIELVECFCEIDKKIPFLKLILVGDFESVLDPLPNSILQEIENNKSIIHVRWSDDVEYYMNMADNFIFPSHREGFPNVLLQAAAMGLPIVCSKITGNIDIVEDNLTGLTFEVCNKHQLKIAILKSLNEKDEMIIMAERLKQIILAEYKRSYIWNRMLLKYSKLLEDLNSSYNIESDSRFLKRHGVFKKFVVISRLHLKFKLNSWAK